MSAKRTAAPAVRATYGYDPLGRRRSKTVNGVVTRWLSVGDQEIAEYTGSTPVLDRRYVYGAGLDEPVATVVASSGAMSFHLTDGLGSVIALVTNAAGVVSEKHGYTAYGAQPAATGTAFQFAGRRLDPETGLYHNRARAYSPALGRFLQADPIGIQGGLNLYAYVGNDPANLVDPMGTTASFINNGGQYSDDLAGRSNRPQPSNELANMCARDCSASFGVEFGISVAGLTLTLPVVPKEGGIAGGGESGKVTSPASTGLRDATGSARIPGSAGRIVKQVVGTNSVGGSVARLLRPLSIIGIFEATDDIAACMAQCIEENMVENGLWER